MTKKEVSKWLAKNLERKQAEFGLADWRIAVTHGASKEAVDRFLTCMQVTAKFQYQRAQIECNPKSYERYTVTEFERSIEHELLHIHMSAFQLVWNFADIHLSRKAFDSFDLLYNRAQEMAVRSLEGFTQKQRGKHGE